jgi:ubiquinone/menaquinone biosynthesis C-methylase UbiE
MSLYRDHVLPRIVDKACARKEFNTLRRDALAGLAGVVVEIGFGSGHNLPHYPPQVRRVLAVEPSLLAQRLAAPRVDAATVDVEFVGLEGQQLPLADDLADAAVSTFTLCTIPNPIAALDELHRVLRPGGALHFLEHGLATDPKVAAWQHRLTPLQRRLCGGCHFDRPIDQLLTTASFEIDELRTFYAAGPKTPSFMYCGIARPT